MLRSELLDIINECEKRYQVSDWIFNNVRIWPLIRNSLFFKNADEYKRINAFYVNTSFYRTLHYLKILKSFLRFCYAYVADCKNNSRVNQKFDAIFLGNQSAMTLLNNRWYDNFSDPIMSCLRKENISCLLMSPGRNFFFPRYSPSLFIQPRLDLNRIIGTWRYRGISNCDDDWIVEYHEMNKYLTIRSKSLKLTKLENIFKKIKIIQNLAEVFKNIFKNTNPAIGLLVSYYSIEGMAFNLACREFGIFSIDIQHGLQGDLHVAYGRWENVPRSGYELLPTHFWCWSEYEMSCIKKWCEKKNTGHTAILGGNMFLEMWRNNDNEIIKSYDDKILSIKQCQPKAKHILYSIQGHEEIDKFDTIMKVMKFMGESCHWWIRLHPSFLDQRQKIKSKLAHQKIARLYEFDMATDLPLYALLRNMDIHLTSISSVVLEASAFKVPSVIITELGASLFHEHVVSRWAKPAYSPQEIMSAIEIQYNKKRSILNKGDDSAKFIKYDGISKLIKMISAVQDKMSLSIPS